jgi:hypothetical protein
VDGLLRNYATPLSFVTFVGVGLTGMLMFFGVRGGPLGEIHEWVGVIFVVALVFHLLRNWRGVLAMLKTPSGKWIAGVFGIVTAAVILLTVPLAGGGHGGGPHGAGQIVNRVASAPIAKMAPALGLTSEQAIARLERGGVEVEGPQQSLTEIAAKEDQELPRLLNLVLTE